MGGLSIWHWVVVLLIVVLVFGTKKLRNVGKDLGGAVHDFKQGLNESNEDGKKAVIDQKTGDDIIEHAKTDAAKDDSKA